MKRKPIVVLLALLLAFTTVIFAACGGTATATLSVKDDFFTVDDTGAYVKVVDADVTEVDVLSNVEVSEGFTLALYSDKELTKKVDKAEISDGMNTFYILATPEKKGQSKTFIVKITRTPRSTSPTPTPRTKSNTTRKTTTRTTFCSKPRTRPARPTRP